MNTNNGKIKEYKDSFYTQLINAIQNKDVQFIQNNLNKFNYKTNQYEKETTTNINLIFNKIIFSGFTEGFCILFDEYFKVNGFNIEYASTNNFHPIISSICHYSRYDMLKYVHQKTGFNLNYKNKEHYGIIHLLFDSINESLSGVSTTSRDEVISFLLWLKDKGVDIYETHPTYKGEVNDADYQVLRKYFHNIFTFCIVKDEYKIALSIYPDNKEDVLRSIKFSDSLIYMLSLIRSKKINEEVNLNNKIDENIFNNVKLKEEVIYAKKLFSKLIDDFVVFNRNDELFVKLLKYDFLFNILDYDFFYYSTNPENILKCWELMKTENLSEKQSLSPISYITRKYFSEIEFYKLILFMLGKGINISDFFKSSTYYIDDFISAFQSQKNKPKIEMFNLQMKLLSLFDENKMSECLPERDSLSYWDLIRYTEKEWI